VPLAIAVDPPGISLDADRALIGQLLVNLLRNAAQAASAHRPDPAVSLRIHRPAPGETAIEVADNGPGVPEGLRGDVFLPFFTTRANGSGVGLNLVRQIVVAHGGSIEIGEGPAGGALFRILL
jgi:two-component system nitrogen regulation sensor histidine kinase NtrY